MNQTKDLVYIGMGKSKHDQPYKIITSTTDLKLCRGLCLNSEYDESIICVYESGSLIQTFKVDDDTIKKHLSNKILVFLKLYCGKSVYSNDDFYGNIVHDFKEFLKLIDFFDQNIGGDFAEKDASEIDYRSFENVGAFVKWVADIILPEKSQSNNILITFEQI